MSPPAFFPTMQRCRLFPSQLACTPGTGTRAMGRAGSPGGRRPIPAPGHGGTGLLGRDASAAPMPVVPRLCGGSKNDSEPSVPCLPRRDAGRAGAPLCPGMLCRRIAKLPRAVMCYDIDQLLFSSLGGNLVESHSFDCIKLSANVVL